MENGPGGRSLRRILTTIATTLILLVIILVFVNIDSFSGVFASLLRICSSVIYGFVFAYLLNPFVRLADRLLLPPLQKRMKRPGQARKLSRVIGILFAFLMAALIIWLLLAMIVPQLGSSILQLVNSLPGYYRSAEAWVLRLLEDNPKILDYANMALERLYGYLDDFLRNDLMNSLQAIVGGVAQSAWSVIMSVVNMIIGLIISIYVLYSKDLFRAQSKKLLVTVFRPETADRVLEWSRQVDRIFNGFILGKLLDSLILGVLCYIGVVIMGAPYGVLIATIIGVTNLIPYVGPILGTVPCALLILLDDPMTCVYFVVFILVLQQVENNIIGPRVMSGSVGVSGFWCLVSLTVGGGLFGVAGMVLSVPVFAVIHMLVADQVNRVLRRRGRPTVTDDYLNIRKVADLEPPRAPEGDAPQQEGK